MIIDHPILKYESDYGAEHCKVVQCDFCQKLAPAGTDMHSAVGKARTAAFITVRGITAVSPRKWSCPACNLRRANSQ